ncbi:Uncharacterised protein [Sphingobacterium spiritivorum]|uniref:DUF4268 domain-containing protein n=1 Tax=Sphingobacterium spiritivorum TaxID=258 RepID=A0A380CW67_SPHSI|nr:DUF4268 domain-containing protein [Sphingobacterium spiritivorum]SUJ30964.1 Uncharacterised protein [Sphingobacterium spiritivorum]
MFEFFNSFEQKLQGFTLYSREESKRIKETFWTKFGQFMSLQPNSEGAKINWINYRTGIKHLYFRMNADKRNAEIMIEISHPDTGIRLLIFEQFEQYKTLLHAVLGEEWNWEKDSYDTDGKKISRIYAAVSGISIYNENDWPELISFFKPRISALDEFWNDAQYGFDLFK